MTTEIERRWFVNTEKFKAMYDVGTLPKKEIIQGYLSVDPDRTVRIRIINQEEAFITIKSRKQGLSCKEFEYPILVEDAEEMLPMCVGQVHKCRVFVEHHWHTFEVDFFADLNDGLVLAELELKSEDTVIDNLPDWLGKEITNDPDLQAVLSNSALAMSPISTTGVPKVEPYDLVRMIVWQRQHLDQMKQK